jgi:hypothetical protein
MASMTRAQQRAYDAKQRRLRKYRERLEHEQRRAQRFLHALEQALFDLGLPETLAAEVEWRLQAQVNSRFAHFWTSSKHCPITR